MQIQTGRGRKDLPARDVVVNHAYAVYRSNARRKGISWELSREDVARTIFCRCNYCKREPTSPEDRGKSPSSGSALFRTPAHGIDRRGNEPHYRASNSVPCCKECNLAKQKMSPAEFLEYHKAVANCQLEEMALSMPEDRFLNEFREFHRSVNNPQRLVH